MDFEIQQIKASDTWALRHRVMWPDQPLSYVVLPNDDEGLHFGVFSGKRLIAVGSLFINVETKEAQFRKLATEVAYQGRGIGTALLNHQLTTAHKNGVRRLWCNARKDKSAFYERFGLEKTAKTFEKGGINYVIMERRF